MCSWCDGGSVNCKVPLKHGSRSLKPPSARACRETRNHTRGPAGRDSGPGWWAHACGTDPCPSLPTWDRQQVATESRMTWAPGRQAHWPGPRTAVLQKHHVLASLPPGTGHLVSSRPISSTWMQERGWKHTEAPPQTVLPRQGTWPCSWTLGPASSCSPLG